MTDVRLTATNPEDSSVVPVACNAKGELLLEDAPVFDGNVDGDLAVSGSASVAHDVVIGKPFSVLNSLRGVRIESAGSYNYLISNDVQPGGGTATCYQHLLNGDQTLALNADGGAEFAGGLANIYNNGTIRAGSNPSGAFGADLSSNGQVRIRTSATEAIRIFSNTGEIETIIAINSDGGAEFSGKLETIGDTAAVHVGIDKDVSKVPFNIYDTAGGGAPIARISGDGSAEFAGDVVVGSRSKKWMLVEQGGLCHMVEQARATTADLANPATEYPPLRDVISELNAIEAALAEVMEKLRMKPPAGWEVWDGSSKNS